MIDAIARELVNRHDVSVSFHGGAYAPEVARYVEMDAALRSAPLRSRRVSGADAALFEMARFVQDTLADRRFTRRAMRWVAARSGPSLRRWRSRLTNVRDVDVYHSPVDPIPRELAGRRDIRKFITVYDLIPRLFPQHFPDEIRDRYERIFRSINRDMYCLCISAHTKRDLCEQCDVDPDRCFVTPLAASSTFRSDVDPASVSAAREQYGIPAGPYFLSLSTLEPRKNFPLVIRAFLKAAEQCGDPDLRLVVVGAKGWNYDAILSEAGKTPGSKQRIVFAGYVADNHLAAVYSSSLGFIYMSQYEGFGLPPLEAMQCGVPVVTSNTSSLPEVVGDAGLMFSPDDEDGVADAILRLYSDAELRADLAVRSVERARQFSWTRCADQTVAAYREALG